ncbi:hypothetical protein HPP92_011342 [Vanilla planifolia]|uniref:Proline-rich protein PRCC n=1 Tax=Vanilla planifolia TaxID=51239 RepID=A0A835RBB0_VANPL|nr:hypothetical protein HPP92_011342 [Vanilla planifolia]
MDSLLANYGSSDDEDEKTRTTLVQQESSLATDLPPHKSFSLFSSLPTPRAPSSSSSFSNSSTSLFSSLPLPKSRLPNRPPTNHDVEEDEGGRSRRESPSRSIRSLSPPRISSPSSNFSSLHEQNSKHEVFSNAPSLHQNPKRVVQFTVPLNHSMLKLCDAGDEDDEDKLKVNKDRKDASSSFKSNALSSMLPAPKNSMCLAPVQSSCASRKSSLQAYDILSTTSSQELATQQDEGCFANNKRHGAEQGVAAEYEAYDAEKQTCFDNSLNYDGNWVEGSLYSSSMDSVNSCDSSTIAWGQLYQNGMDCENYKTNWSCGSEGERISDAFDIGRIKGKRGRSDMAAEILEVKQDELMKNRPREDQFKLTGIAFGPAYQPSSSTKAKPSKLHKRKHQIGSLYYDMKQKEMELAERRSRGLLTKAETQAKYGW